jgi:hypothetical protein
MSNPPSSALKVLFLLLSSSVSVKSFSIAPSIVNVPMIVKEAEIRSADWTTTAAAEKTSRVAYNAGIGIHEPILSANRHNIVQSALNEPYAFLVDHDAINQIEPESVWRKQYLVDTNSKSKVKHLPSVVLNRFTDNDEISLHYDDESVEVVRASAKTSIRRNYDLNTPWLEVLIHNEKQKRIAQAINSNNSNLVTVAV